jgi:hypothetical protein
LRLATFFLAAFFLAVFFFAVLRLTVLRAGDLFFFVVRAAAMVVFSGSVSGVANGSSAEVVFSDIANLVLSDCSVVMMVIGSSSFESKPIQ